MTRPNVDDREEFLDSATTFLSRNPRVKIVGRALNGPDGIRLASDLNCDAPGPLAQAGETQ